MSALWSLIHCCRNSDILARRDSRPAITAEMIAAEIAAIADTTAAITGIVDAVQEPTYLPS